jgi:hypothetical protein
MATSFALSFGEPLVLLAPLSVALQVLATCHTQELGGLADLTGLGFYDWTGLWWPFPGSEATPSPEQGAEGGDARQATVAIAASGQSSDAPVAPDDSASESKGECARSQPGVLTADSGQGP